jgi:hypothetical protein
MVLHLVNIADLEKLMAIQRAGRRRLMNRRDGIVKPANPGWAD